MIIAYFVTMGYYGFWLPNDERGSGSSYVGSKRLLPYGNATGRSDRRQSRATIPHNHTARRLAKMALKYPAVMLTGEQAWSVAQVFANAVETSDLLVLACSIMPDHSHLVIGKHRLSVEQIVIQLKAKASARLGEDGRHPLQSLARSDKTLPTMWGRGSWNVYLNTPAEVQQKIIYTEENPIRQGLPKQRWGFVRPF